MAWVSNRNISFATVAALREIAHKGETIVVRGSEVKELRNRVTVLTSPRERCLFVPFRRNSVIASVAETLWVLSGRDDIAWLSAYLPRAPDYSDDGRTWRGAYGPRLRNWLGVDQFARVRDLLIADLPTRRAVMSIFDPSRDFAQSKDIPCNNWLHWMVRGNRLHLNVAVRSNDVWWGFSGVNSFEWSVLQEAMANWVGATVGELTFLATSLHLYERHYAAAERAAAAFRGITCYDFGIPPAPFTPAWSELDRTLSNWMSLEHEVRTSPDTPIPSEQLPRDEFLRTAILVLRAFLGAKSGWTTSSLREALAGVPENDLAAAAYEYFGRDHPVLLEDIPHARIAAFIGEYQSGRRELRNIPFARIKAGIKALHREKDAAYQNSWKRRGEFVSTLANVARKVDRLETSVRTGVALSDESILDTAVDLYVYLTKYRLLLLESLPAVGEELLPGAPKPYSDHVTNFETLVDRAPPQLPNDDGSTPLIRSIFGDFEQLIDLGARTSERADRLKSADLLSSLAWRLVVTLIKEQPDRLEYFRVMPG
jgi:thymidylate synthase